jgi:hypothetical protein
VTPMCADIKTPIHSCATSADRPARLAEHAL